MSTATYHWLTAGHVIGVILWMGGLFSVYWLLRLHAHAPPQVHEKLTLMERSLALMMDLASALAIGCGVAMIFSQKPNMLAAPNMGWLHIKLTVVVLGVLPVHGMVRASIKRFGRGEVKPVPEWLWSLLLAAVVTIVILVTRVKYSSMMP